ncbi:MAG: 2Fe-2S iron-sulfur cluster-binding protein [Burkholderiales bacterium]
MSIAMTVVVLNGAASSTDAVGVLCTEVERQLAAQFGTVRTFHLAGYDIGHCMGEFDCFVKTPGRCRIHDEGQEIARAVHHAELVVLLTPLRYGGYSPQLKMAVDRLLPLISPFFRKAGDMTHHALRYEHRARWAALALDDTPSPERTRLFRAFAETNALNFGSPAWGAAVVSGNRAAWPAAIASALTTPGVPGNASGTLEGARAELMRAAHALVTAAAFPPRPKVAVLQVSPRPAGVSTSQAIWHYLKPLMEAGAAQVEVVAATDFVRSAAVAQVAGQRCAQADLLLIIGPLYWDSLPYPGLLALQHIHAERRKSGLRRARMVGVMNCGFAEPEQFRFAFGLLREFAHEAGYTWAGGLPVGGGEAINGRALERVGTLMRPLRHAIDSGMPALLAGDLLPDAACDAAAIQITPGALYRFFGWWGWHMKRLAHGLSASEVHARPFDDLSDAEWERMAAAGPARARPLRVAAMLPEGADAVTVVFDDPARHAEHFEAGQYLTLQVPIHGDRVRRAYSLATAPCDGGLAITVKRVPGGLMSNWIHDQWSVGDFVRCFGPSGDFTAGLPPSQGPRRLLLVAGGSGIVPLQAVARQVLHDEPVAEVTLVYGSSALERAIFAAPLQQQALDRAPRLRLHWVFETAPAACDGPAFTVGRLDAPTLAAVLRDTDLGGFHRAMVCGPDAMRAAVRQALLAGGLPAERLFEESFVSPRRGAVSDQAQPAVFESPDGEQTVMLRPGDTLLEAALNAGIALPFSCCSGGCGACRVRITEHLNHVLLDEPNTVTPEDRSRGEVPACLVRLTGPCHFRLP